MKYLLLVLILLLLTISIVDARVYKVSYTEPSTNSDGSQLADLAFCSVYYKIPGGNEIKEWDNPAASPAGGGVITEKPTSDIAVSPAQSEQVEFRLNCTDLTGLFGGFCPVVRLTLVPGFPIGVLIK